MCVCLRQSLEYVLKSFFQPEQPKKRVWRKGTWFGCRKAEKRMWRFIFLFLSVLFWRGVPAPFPFFCLVRLLFRICPSLYSSHHRQHTLLGVLSSLLCVVLFLSCFLSQACDHGLHFVTTQQTTFSPPDWGMLRKSRCVLIFP